MIKYLSKVTLTACGAVFALGVFEGRFLYTHRSHALEAHVSGSNANAQHLILLVGVVLAVVISVFYHRKAPKKPYIIWLAPFTPEALHRVKLTVLGGRQSYLSTARATVAALLSLAMLFYFFRAGAQIFGSADPNFVVNARGGPSRLGASLADWMDAGILFYITAGIATLITVRMPLRKKKSKL